MQRQMSLEYWIDGPWFVGRLPEVPGVFSQGTTLAELEENVRDAYLEMIASDEIALHPGAKRKDIVVDVL